MRRLALFAHYDAGGRVRPFIEHFLRELRTVCDEIAFVSTAKLSSTELDKVRPFCARATTKQNFGFDFGMWRDALEGVDLEQWDEIVLTNSSLFGPIHPLRRVFDRMDKVECDAWGMTDNLEIAWHIQSYFLVFRRSVLVAPVFREFWRSILPYTDKDQLIRSYEVGLSRLLLDQGFALRAMVGQNDFHGSVLPPRMALADLDAWWSTVARRAGLTPAAMNLTTTQPVELLRAGMPFVKIELLRDNPRSIPLEPVLKEMAASGFDMSLIEFDRPFKARGLTPERLASLARGETP
ncbi:MAG: rhamnan synthesis F family protein [Polyangiales bacterium]